MMNSHDTAFADHPIHLPTTFYISTPMADELLTQLTQWLWCGATGGFILGSARLGKSRAIRAAMAQVRGRDGENIPCHYMSVAERDKKTITSVFRKLAFAVGKHPKDKDKADLIADDLVHFFAESALASRYRQVILFVDEFQRLLIAQLGAFAELHNTLAEAELANLVVVFIGNTGESDRLMQQLQEPRHDHIRGRFFTQGYRFTGLRHHEDVKHCLRAYDTTRYPAHSGLSVTEYFLPRAFQHGWRLESLSHLMWSVYHEHYQRSLQIPSWGMQYFTATVKTLLVDYLRVDGIERKEQFESMVHESIKVSGLVPTLVSEWKQC